MRIRIANGDEFETRSDDIEAFAREWRKSMRRGRMMTVVVQGNALVAINPDAICWATIESLGERVRETEAYAREGWEWLAVALDAGGWPTVFDIPDWQQHNKKLTEAGVDGHKGAAQARVTELEGQVEGLEAAMRRLMKASDPFGGLSVELNAALDNCLDALSPSERSSDE